MSDETPADTDVVAPTGPEVRPGGSSRQDLRSDCIAIAAVMLVCLAFNWLHVSAYTKLSPLDELQHIDYLFRAADGEIVGRGDVVEDEAMREQGCRGIDWETPVLDCRPLGDYEVSEFQEGGQNTAYIHSPVYYYVTAWISKLANEVTPASNLVTAGRLLGPAWVFPAVVLMVVTMRRLRVGLLVRTAVPILAVTTPMVLHATATVNPDATALLGGALVICTPILLGRRRSRTGGRLADAAAGALAMALKPSNLVVLVAGAWMRSDMVVIDADTATGTETPTGTATATDDEPAATGQPARQASWSSKLMAVVVAVAPLAIGAVVASVIVLLIQSRSARADPDEIGMISRYVVDAFPWAQLSESMLTPGHFSSAGNGSNYLAGFLRSPLVVVCSGILAIGTLGLTVAGAFRRDSAGSVARATLIATVLGGPVLIVLNYVVQGIYVAIPSRYYMSLIPGAAIAAAAVASQWRPAARLTAAFTCVWVLGLGFALVAAN